MAKSVYDEVYARSMKDPEGFWARAAEAIHWEKRWDRVFDDSRKPFYRWFTGGVLNTCYNALDLHIDRGRGKQRALVYDSPVTNTVRVFTYAELRDAVARVAGALRRQGIKKGDRVIVYMPIVPEAVVAMLACARIGAVHSVVFGGFASNELAKRIDDARPRLILSASCGIEVNRVVPYKPLLDGAIAAAAHKPERCVILQRSQEAAPLVRGRDLDWEDFVAGGEPADCAPVAATDPLYILYTSGTTGVPKGVVRDNGGHAVALKWSMEGIYGVGAGEVYWAASDIGWVVGQSYIVYAPLLAGCTTILYEGKPVGRPVPGYDVRVLGEDNQEMPAGQIGSIAIKLPLPPGCLPTLWNNDVGYEKSYLTKHPDHYLTGDAGYKDDDGYLYIMSRVDDIINVAGHRLSTGAMEEVLAAHPDVAECAVIGVADEIKGEVPVGFVVTKAGVARSEAEIVRELVERVRTE